MTGGHSVSRSLVYQSPRSLRTNVLSVSKIFPKLAPPHTRRASGAEAVLLEIWTHPGSEYRQASEGAMATDNSAKAADFGRRIRATVACGGDKIRACSMATFGSHWITSRAPTPGS